MVGSFMRYKLHVTVNEMEDEALTQIFAGSDTTAIVVRSVRFHVIAAGAAAIAAGAAAVPRDGEPELEWKISRQRVQHSNRRKNEN